MLNFFSQIWGGDGRSSKWPAVRNAFLKGKDCAACGSNSNLEAHHIVPFHVPGGDRLELEPSNLIAFCRDCHLTWGHLRNWSSWNVSCAEDAEYYRSRVQNRP